MEVATFAAGCFWGVEEVFLDLPGVEATRVGYCGGHSYNPTYKDVCGSDTGHAEAVEVTFDTDKISYADLLDVFWKCHDPTQVNRQGPDFGEQYRSAIFYHTESQYEAARASVADLENRHLFRRPIATQIVPTAQFWEAEAYHQKYHQKNGGGCGF
ncbi:MAG: peptide-methionine (S)-S-oxide reductase MsrA [Desulfuromonadaceae bacterium]|nr:peptide-methionine (S)-S-oxide reductase MsrA [Desulfuromonadaceae bacterium]MDD5107371.1 peptide-methionine (S)-S-oxide reductase MsrA [Desulfuromonadaceae bacterium]